MTTPEFSNEFDILYNNIMSNQAPGLDEYEKSVFLTKAQDEIIKNYFNPKGNKYQEGFDGNQKRQIDFSSLIVSKKLELSRLDNELKFDLRSYPFIFPHDLFLVINEQLTVGNSIYTVVPINYMEYDRLMSKPYKYPIKNHAWRLLTKNTSIKSEVFVKSPYVDNDFIFVNSQEKPVKVTVLIGDYDVSDTANHPPIIEEGEDLVTITINIPKDVPSTGYWGMFLLNGTGQRGEADLSPYLGRFTNAWDDSAWPYFIPTANPGTIIVEYTISGIPKNGTVPIAEIIGNFSSSPTYKVRYLKRPVPIILTSLPDDLSIEGVSSKSECELPEELHGEILQRAVELAKAAYIGDLKSSVELGQRSE